MHKSDGRGVERVGGGNGLTGAGIGEDQKKTNGEMANQQLNQKDSFVEWATAQKRRQAAALQMRELA